MYRYLKTLLLTAAGLTLLVSLSYSQLADPTQTGGQSGSSVISTVVPFLTIAPDARAAAMGDVGVATSPDANSVHWNPAKLAFLDDQIGFALSYTPWLGKIVNDMSISYLSGYYKITREQAVALSLRYFDMGDIFFTLEDGTANGSHNPKEVAIDATYSRMLTEQLSVGVTARFIHSNLTGPLDDASPASSSAVDLSVYYHSDLIFSGRNAKLALGANISNIGSKLTYTNSENKDFIPTNLRLGSSFSTDIDPFNSITLAVDINKLLVPSVNNDSTQTLLSGIFGSFGDAPGGIKEEMREIMISTGLEYWYNNTFAVRAGYYHESQDKGNRKYFTAGIGFRYQVFGVDFAYLVPTQQEHPLAETLRLSLVFAFENYGSQNESVTD